MTPDPDQLLVIAPNLKRRLSGVTATIARLVPIQAKRIAIAATGPGLPPDLPHIPLWRCFLLSRDRLRVWHARRNTEMLLGIVLRGVFRRRLALLFTSASQRRHSSYTRWLIGQTDGLVATSRKTAAYLDRPAEVILHGIDTVSFSPTDDRRALRIRLGLDPDATTLGCFGRIRAQKGTDVFVEMAITLLRDRPGAQAIVLGRVTNGNEAFQRDLQTRIDTAGLAERIRFLPEVPVDQIADWYRALDLYVAPQRWEGFGLTPLEAMACGVPVVATRVGAFEEIVMDGETGSLVPPGDPEALADAAAPFLDDPELLAERSVRAREVVLDRFRLEGEADALIAVYRRLLDGGRW